MKNKEKVQPLPSEVALFICDRTFCDDDGYYKTALRTSVTQWFPATKEIKAVLEEFCRVADYDLLGGHQRLVLVERVLLEGDLTLEKIGKYVAQKKEEAEEKARKAKEAAERRALEGKNKKKKSVKKSIKSLLAELSPEDRLALAIEIKESQ